MIWEAPLCKGRWPLSKEAEAGGEALQPPSQALPSLRTRRRVLGGLARTKMQGKSCSASSPGSLGFAGSRRCSPPGQAAGNAPQSHTEPPAPAFREKPRITLSQSRCLTSFLFLAQLTLHSGTTLAVSLQAPHTPQHAAQSCCPPGRDPVPSGQF